MILASQPLPSAKPPFPRSHLTSRSRLAAPASRTLGGQSLCFDNHLNCPGCTSVASVPSVLRFPPSARSVFSATCSLFFSLCSLFADALLCFQSLAASFSKTPGVWVSHAVLRHARTLSTPRRWSGRISGESPRLLCELNVQSVTAAKMHDAQSICGTNFLLHAIQMVLDGLL